MDKIRILLIEDEEAAAERMKKMILRIEPGVEIVDSIVSVKTAIDFFRKNIPLDLIILDINLSDGSSFEIFSHVSVKTPIIFTTAYDEFALKAFRLNSVDYLLKPIKEEELRNAISKFKEIHIKKNAEIDYLKLAQVITSSRPEYRERIVTRFGGLLKIINISDCSYFFTENKVTYATTKQNGKFAIDENLDELEAMLDPKQFFRINRQFIVGIKSIEKMVVVSKSRVKITLNPPSELETIASTERSSTFKKWIEGS